MLHKRMERITVRDASRNALLTVIAIVLVLPVAVSCSQSLPSPSPSAATNPIPIIPTPEPTPTTPHIPQTRLDLALSWVPLQYAGLVIEFADHAASRMATDLVDVRGYDDYEELDEQERDRFYEGVSAAHQDLSGWRSLVPQTYGFDPWAFDLGVWSGPSNQPMPRFIITEGGWDAEAVVDRLEALGNHERELAYEKADYKGTPYFTRSQDYRFPLATSHPNVSAELNRVVVEDDRLLAAPATFIIEDLIDVREGDAPSLIESQAHLLLARGIGQGLIGGVFITSDWIAEHAVGSFRFSNRQRCSPTTVGVCEWFSDALDMHLAEPDPWGKLSPYDVALLGYRVQGDTEETVIALHYSDPDAAKRDAEELAKRWNSFHLFVEFGVPVTDSCAPLSTKIEEAENHSLLLATCSVIRGTSEDDEPFMPGPDLWIHLFYFGSKLEFLALDLEEQKRLAEDREREERSRR